MIHPGMTSRHGQRGRIFVDVSTSLAWRGRHAVGIVRVEREITLRLLDAPDLAVVPVVFHHGSFRAIDPDAARLLALPAEPGVAAPLDVPDGGIGPAPAAVPRTGLRRLLRPIGSLARATARALLRCAPPSVREDWRQALLRGRQAVRNLVYGRGADASLPIGPPPLDGLAAGAAASEQPVDFSLVVHPGPDDLLFLCGLAWDVIDWQVVEALRAECGLRVVTVMYDLIPIKLPEVCHTVTTYPFLNCFLHILDNSSLILCISECTRADLLAFAADMGRPMPNATVFTLGADVPAAADAGALARFGLVERLAGRRFALAVGTFEARKNYALVIDLWHELVKDPDFDLDLVIVGMEGWKVGEVIDRLKASPLYGTRIFWLQKVTDGGLSWLYEMCHFLVFPSLYEGWGLPVVEALQHGRPAIVSSRGATPEAGYGLATVVDPADRTAWYRAIAEAARAPRRTLDVPRFPSWNDAAASVKASLAGLLFVVEDVA